MMTEVRRTMSREFKRSGERPRRTLTLNEVLASRNEKEIEQLLRAFLTPKELAQIEQRLTAFQLLVVGGTQRSVSVALGAAIATVSRVAGTIRENPAIIQTALRGHT